MKKQLTVLLSFSLALIIFQNAPSLFAGTATIDAGTKYQSISGFGACSQWVESKITAALATQFWADDNVNGHAGLSIIRIGIPPQGSGNWGAPCNSAKQALAINPNILVFASPWSPPANYKNNNSTTGNNAGNTGTNPGGNTNQLNTSHYGDYATYLTSFVNACKNTYGFNLFALSVQNEPDYDTSYDSCVWSNTAMDTFIGTNLGPTLQAAGYTNIIMMPESFACNLNMSATTMGNANSAKYVKVIGEHLYGGGPNPLPASYATTAGHPVEMWETEYSMKTSTNDMTSGIFYANSLHKCVVDNNYNAWLYWWLVLSSGTDDEGLCDANGVTTKRLYTLGNYSKFVRPGAVRIAATEYPSTNLATSAYIMTALNRYVIVCVNNNGSAQSTTFNLNGISTSSVTPWLTDASNNLVAQTAVGVSANSFTYNIPANSVMSFVGTMSTGPSPTNTPYAGTPTFTATASPTPHSILLDDMEDGDNVNNWGGSWYSYSGTGTTITPKPFVMTAGGMTGSPNYRAQIAATVADYAGLGTNLAAGDGSVAVDLTNYTTLEFYIMGNGGSYWFQFVQPSITDGDQFGVTFTAPSGVWTKVTVPINAGSLGQRGFGAASTFIKNAITALQWSSNANGALDIRVDDVRLYTSVAMSPTFTLTRTPGGTFTYTRTPTATNSRTQTNTPVNTSTNTFTRTATASVTPANTSTYTQTRTNTPVSTATNTPVNTLTNTPVNTFTSTATRTPSNTPVNTLTNTPVNSATFTRTNTPVNSATNTPVNTSTFTRTRSPSPTATASSSNTPANTATNTPVNTYTLTRTNTPVNTATNTPVNTSTFTATAGLTRTYTATATFTSSVTPSPSRTSTATPTITCACSETFTSTRTATVQNPTNTPTATPAITVSLTYTRTASPSFTATRTLTLTLTATGTPTSTRTMTSSRTPTSTRTDSPVYSPTDTWTGTPPTETVTPTVTETETEIPTDTVTPSETPSSIPTSTVSPSRTATVTQTRTATVTPSRTVTITPSGTPTVTLTNTAIINTVTFTRTVTQTSTSSAIPTATRTYTLTATPTNTSVNTATRTSTALPSPTFTPAVTWGSIFTIDDTKTYPNPYLEGSGDLRVNITISRPAGELKVRIYTTGFRCILEMPAGSANTRDAVITIQGRKLTRLAAGTYYMIVTGVSTDNERAISKPAVLIILK